MNRIVSNGNKLKWKFENVIKLRPSLFGSEIKYSDKFTFEGINWNINVCTTPQNVIEYLTVYLMYDGDNKTEKTWICETRNIIKLLNQNENGEDITAEDVFLYDASVYIWSYKMIEWWELESDGYIKDNSIIVEIELDFKYYDFSKNIPNYTDITFDVDDTKFYVNKELLCSKSEYFHNKFIVEMSDETELTIENVKAEDFRYFIASVCLFFETVREKNYEQLIKLAAEYKTPLLHRNCEKFLISHTTLQAEKKIDYADKYDYDELLKTGIDSLTTIDQIEKLIKSTEYEKMKNTTKLAIGKKMIDILNKLEENEEELKCQSCTNMDFEKNLQICQTCDEQNLNDSKNEEDVLKIALCSTCALRKHDRQGHVTIDFLPHYLVCRFKNQSEEVGTMLESFQQVENSRKDEEQTWKTMNETADIKFNGLVDLTRWSKSTKHLQENMDNIKGFMKTAKDVNESLIEVMKTKKIMLQQNLQELEKWIEEKSKECVKDEETIKLEI